MKHIHKGIPGFLLLLCILSAGKHIDAQEDSSKPEVSVNIHHVTVNNSFQYLIVETKIKANNKWQPWKGQDLQVYLDSAKAENLISKAQSDSEGKAKVVIPAGLKSAWDATPGHKFIAIAKDGTEGESEISKSKILIDTSNVDGTRTVNVQVMKWENNAWSPAKGIDVKLGIKRLGGDLNIGDEESYTTDSLGSVAAEFKGDSLPGDRNGNLTLIAKVEDDDQYGSLSIEKTVPWGVYVNVENDFGHRALWGTRGKAPVWLMFIVYSSIVAVWGVMFFLVLQIIRISNMGKDATKTKEEPRKVSAV